MKNHRVKVAMAISAVLMILWGVLGAGATLAWFGETTEVVTNRFNIGELDLKVSYRLDDGRYVPVLEDTKLFDLSSPCPPFTWNSCLPQDPDA